MLITRVGIVLLGWILGSILLEGKETAYTPRGPAEFAELEKALHGFLPVYVEGIPPRAQILERAIRKDELLPPEVSKIEEWINRVLRPDLRAQSTEDIVMFKVPKLRWDRDFIVGHISCESCDAWDRSKAVEFQADDTRIGLTIHSASVLVPQTGVLGPERIVAIVSRFLSIPEDKIPRITVEFYPAQVNGKGVCYGKLRCEWNDAKSQPEDCRWWSYIPFWITDHRVYASISTIDWEHGERLPASANSTWREREYVPRGPREAAEFEKALYDLQGGYEQGVAPRTEILQRGIPKDKLPAAYVSKIETWIVRVLQPEYKPKRSEDISMFGVPRLHWDWDFIVGRFGCDSCDAPDRSKAVEFQAYDRGLSLTIHSESVLLPESSDPSVEQIVAAVSHFLAIPEDKVPRITVEHRLAEVDGIRLCYGKLRCAWHELQGMDPDGWWSYIPFWMKEGTLYVNISTIDWQSRDRPASAKSTWNLEPAVKGKQAIND